MVAVITVVFALSCVYMGFVQGPIMLGIGFVFIRMCGQGSLWMISSNVVNLWWVQRRGMVSGIGRLAASLLGGLFPPLVHALIGNYGWRSSFVLLGLMVAALMLPVGLIFFRRQPEDYGLLPDGATVPTQDKASNEPAFVEENWTSAEAIRTQAFWIVGLGLAILAMLSTGLQFHIVSIFKDSGLSASLAAAVFVPISITNAIVTFGSGLLVDRFAVRFLLFGALIAQAATLLMAPHLENVFTALLFGVILGIAGSLQATVNAVVWAKYYGRRHLGSITGIAALVVIAGSALGPMPMGIARDVFGGYALTLTFAAALPLALGVVVLFIRQPHKGTDTLSL